MRVLDRKLFRELISARWRLMAIMSIVGVGVACFVAMGSAYNNLTRAKQRYYRQCRMADFWIDLKKVPLAELESLAGIRGVAEIRPRIQFSATVDLDASVKPLNGLILSLPDRREPILNDVVLRRGGYFTDRRENEVLVNDAFARHHRLRPGQWIRLVLNNRRQELFIVGTAISSEFVYLLGPGAIMPDPEHFGVFYIKRSYAEDVFDFEGAANQMVGRFTPSGRRHPQAVLDRAKRLLEDFGVFATTPLKDQPSNNYLSQEIAGLESFAVFMPAIFLTVAALVLNVLLTRLAEQERTVVGTLKALGYSDRQIFLHFLEFGLAVGLAGAILGGGAGYGLSEMMTREYRKYFEFPQLDNAFYFGLQAIALAISLGCAVLGSMHGTHVVLRLNPAEAMRPKPPRQGGAILLERVGWLWQRLSTSWRMVLRSVVRNRVRTAAGAFAAMMGASVLVTGFMMSEATYYLIDFQFRWIQRSDIDLYFKDEQSADALLEAARLPAVDRAEPVLSVACTFHSGPFEKKGAITGLLPDARLTIPRDRQGRAIRIPQTGIMMSRKLAELLRLQRGDTVTIIPTQGLRREREAPVLEIVDSFIGTAVYADIHYLSRLVGEEFAVSGVQLATDGNPRHTEALYRALKELPALQAVNSRSDMIEALETTVLRNMWVFIGLLVLFAGIVFFGSILNASLVSLAERRREVATLRVLGYNPWQIGAMLLRESMMITILGTLLGMPVGYLLSVATSAAYDTEMFRFPVVASAGTWGWTIVLAILFSLAAHAFVQLAIHRMDWLEALQAKE